MHLLVVSASTRKGGNGKGVLRAKTANTYFGLRSTSKVGDKKAHDAHMVQDANMARASP